MATLKFNTVAITLAQGIYYARAEAFGLPYRAWESLDATAKHLYVQQAADILDANRPTSANSLKPRSDLFEAVAGMARREAAKVVGVIDESRPWGERTR